MIFVTVGTQLPFDRMVRAIDEWAGLTGRRDVFAQVGHSSLRPRHMEWAQSLAPPVFQRMLAQADVIVAHAGMGSIIMALELAKPIVVVPRRAELGEHRNDHQLATARQFVDLGLVRAAFDEREVGPMIDSLAAAQGARNASSDRCPRRKAGCSRYDPVLCEARDPREGCPKLVMTVSRFIDGEHSSRRSAAIAPEAAGGVLR